MTVALAQRIPSPQEFERFRLVLSTYQDGTGMLAGQAGGSLPGWRDFERTVALVFEGIASENKDIFDVRLPDPARSGISYGVSCKMKEELRRMDSSGRAYMELSNSAKKFWAALNNQGITQINYKEHPQTVGIILVELVQSWHAAVSVEEGGQVDISNSFYLTLSYDKTGGWYQLHKFSLELPDPQTLKWYYPTHKRNGEERLGNLTGYDGQGRIFEWYGESGGQLKYYPLIENALWQSERFQLEPLPEGIAHGILSKAQAYFPNQWAV